ETVEAAPGNDALLWAGERMSYAELAVGVRQAASGLVDLGFGRGDRVAIYLPKQPETVVAMFAASAAGTVFVPINPVLKAAQVGHILRDSGAALLVTNASRAASLESELRACPELRHVVLV